MIMTITTSKLFCAASRSSISDGDSVAATSNYQLRSFSLRMSRLVRLSSTMSTRLPCTHSIRRWRIYGSGSAAHLIGDSTLSANPSGPLPTGSDDMKPSVGRQ